VGCQDWYLVQSFCPGLRVCPLEWYMYSSPSPERFSLCSILYLFGFNIRSCNKSQLFLSKWIFTLYFTNYVREGYLIPSMISYEVKPTMPFWWYLRSIVATLLGVFNPPVPSYKCHIKSKAKRLRHKSKPWRPWISSFHMTLLNSTGQSKFPEALTLSNRVLVMAITGPHI